MNNVLPNVMPARNVINAASIGISLTKDQLSSIFLKLG